MENDTPVLTSSSLTFRENAASWLQSLLQPDTALLLGIGVAFSLVLVQLAFFRQWETWQQSLGDELVALFCSLLAVGGLSLGAFNTRANGNRLRRAWIFLTVAAACGAAGDGLVLLMQSFYGSVSF